VAYEATGKNGQRNLAETLKTQKLDFCKIQNQGVKLSN
jgi:hypothetical protein